MAGRPGDRPPSSWRGRLALFVALQLAWGAPLRGEAPPLPSDPGVAKGRAQIEDRDYAAAAETLQGALVRLAEPSPDRALAQFYRAVALAATGQEEEARRLFGEALRAIPGLTVEAGSFPVGVGRSFEAARASPPRSPSPTASPPGPTGGGGSHRGAILLGAAAAAGFAVAVASRSTSQAAQAPDARRAETFSGTLSPDAGQRPFDVVVGSAGILEATITWVETSVVFTVELDDEHFTRLATSVGTSPVSSTLSAAVTPRTSAPDAAYKVLIQRQDTVPGPAAYTLVVQHP